MKAIYKLCSFKLVFVLYYLISSIVSNLSTLIYTWWPQHYVSVKKEQGFSGRSLFVVGVFYASWRMLLAFLSVFYLFCGMYRSFGCFGIEHPQSSFLALGILRCPKKILRFSTVFGDPCTSYNSHLQRQLHLFHLFTKAFHILYTNTCECVDTYIQTISHVQFPNVFQYELSHKPCASKYEVGHIFELLLKIYTVSFGSFKKGSLGSECKVIMH